MTITSESEHDAALERLYELWFEPICDEWYALTRAILEYEAGTWPWCGSDVSATGVES